LALRHQAFGMEVGDPVDELLAQQNVQRSDPVEEVGGLPVNRIVSAAWRCRLMRQINRVFICVVQSSRRAREVLL
jgi:hypothetical protein